MGLYSFNVGLRGRQPLCLVFKSPHADECTEGSVVAHCEVQIHITQPCVGSFAILINIKKKEE